MHQMIFYIKRKGLYESRVFSILPDKEADPAIVAKHAEDLGFLLIGSRSHHASGRIFYSLSG